jgi:hypothetical protein
MQKWDLTDPVENKALFYHKIAPQKCFRGSTLCASFPSFLIFIKNISKYNTTIKIYFFYLYTKIDSAQYIHTNTNI